MMYLSCRWIEEMRYGLQAVDVQVRRVDMRIVYQVRPEAAISLVGPPRMPGMSCPTEAHHAGGHGLADWAATRDNRYPQCRAGLRFQRRADRFPVVGARAACSPGNVVVVTELHTHPPPGPSCSVLQVEPSNDNAPAVDRCRESRRFIELNSFVQ